MNKFDETFIKTVNFTDVAFMIVNSELQPLNVAYRIPRKLNKKQIMALLRSIHGAALIDQSVTYNHYNESYELAISDLIKHGTRIQPENGLS